ncbi:MAG: fumarate hydratase [Bacillota bacterium]
MREVNVSEVRDVVRDLCIKSNYYLPEEALDAMKRAAEEEESPVGREVLELLIENAETAAREQMPICQDTGTAVIFLEVGQDVHFTGGGLVEAINEGVRRGYADGYLRKSMTVDPFFRDNTGDNTPAVIYTDIVDGEGIKISIAPKGGGAENMSVARGLTPAGGMEGVKKFVVETVDRAGSNPCPPIVVGVGVGSTMDKAMLLAKKSLLRPLGTPSPHEHIAELERSTLEAVNDLGIGPQGLGGRTTALAVHIEPHSSHIASLIAAVNIQCHAARHASATI